MEENNALALAMANNELAMDDNTALAIGFDYELAMDDNTALTIGSNNELAMDDNTALAIKPKKKTKGRIKIPLDQKIQKKAHLQVTFTKRRQGLFKKASQLSVLTGADVAILVRSPAGKIFAFGSPSAEAVIGRYEGGPGSMSIMSQWQNNKQVESRKKYEEVARELEMLKDGGSQKWWEKSFEAMGLEELERFAQDLEKLGEQFLADPDSGVTQN